MFDTILLIDDDEATNYLHKFYIDEWGIASQIHAVGDGQEALTFLEKNVALFKNKNSLILLDINMPVMNGFEFLQKYTFLEVDKKSSCLLVMLSTDLSTEYQKHASTLKDIDGFTKKPLKQTDIVQKSVGFLNPRVVG